MTRTLLALALTAAPTALLAQQAPVATPIADTIPSAQDKPYAGTITLDIDASGAPQGIFRTTETIPVAGPGPLVLLYPEWKPGNHSPTGQAKNLAGLTFTAGGRPLAWRRDTVDMFAFHLDVPAGVRSIEARFQYLSPLSDGADRVVVAPTMLNLQWEAMSLYPAGTYVRNMAVKANVTYPAGWTAFSALRGTKTGARVSYEPTQYDILVDSPVYAGLYTKQVALDPAVSLDLVGDTPEEIAITPEQIGYHKALVVQADRLFGARHYDHYDFLLAMSDTQSGDGLEHHRSSENTLSSDLLTDWTANVADRYVVAHEYTHSWNGKFRRPADLWTPDYRTPMQDSLLWVYEGQTQFWGDVLAARSGLWSRQEYLDTLASVASSYTDGTPGAAWRPLQDTTNDPIATNHGSISAWQGWSRAFDYYRNAELIWLEADQTIRDLSNGARGLDDFARVFFGKRPGVWNTEDTYTFADVVAALNQVQPYDWAGFLRQRLDGLSPATTLAGIAKGGYRLVYTDTPNVSAQAVYAKRKFASFLYSLGLSASAKDGRLTEVLWSGPAYAAGLAPGDTIVAIDGRAFSPERLAGAVSAAKTGKAPITLLVSNADRFRTVAIDYHGGLRYPHLEKVGTGPAGLDRLITAK